MCTGPGCAQPEPPVVLLLPCVWVCFARRMSFQNQSADKMGGGDVRFLPNPLEVKGKDARASPRCGGTLFSAQKPSAESGAGEKLF